MDIITESFGNSVSIDYYDAEGTFTSVKLRLFNLHHGQVKFGIEAPRHVRIYREELQQHLYAERNET